MDDPAPDLGTAAPEPEGPPVDGAGPATSPEAPPADGADRATPTESSADRGERRYKRSVAMLLALLALLGAWIAILQTNAATNESRTAREATRLGTQAQAARVVDLALDTASTQVGAEIDVLALRRAFTDPFTGAALDTAEVQRLLAQAKQAVSDAASPEIESRRLVLKQRANELGLSNSALVETRITWNARASQYETVMTVLAVAIFLVGFSLVLSRKVRPPVLVPGVALAVFTFGWAIHIYNKPIPSVDDTVIEATARGQALFDTGAVDESIPAFDQAIAVDDHYRSAYDGRALAHLVQSNPDVLAGLVFTDTTGPAFEAARRDIDRSLDLGGNDDPVSLTLAGFAAFAAGDYDSAADHLERVVVLNDLTPAVQLALSATEVARGDEEAALEWRKRAVALLGPVEASDANRALAAQYYNLLEQVAARRPERAELAALFRDEVVAAETEVVVGRPVTGVAPAGVTFDIETADYADGALTVRPRITGVPDDAAMALLGYVRPVAGGPWDQVAELAYFGTPIGTRDEPTRLAVPRTCAPTELRFDLYVEGALVGSQTRPGVAPTCG